MFLGLDREAYPAQKFPEKKAVSKVRRPDWYHTVHAQHRATTWRKAYYAWRAGHGPARMGGTDEVTFTVQDWEDLRDRDRPMFRVDQLGRTIGSWKIKTMETVPTSG